MREWQSLVQVCKRWQEIIYASPRYLDLFLYFSNQDADAIAETLDLWPELPLFLGYSFPDEYYEYEGYDTLYNALAYRDRIHHVVLFLRPGDANRIAESMMDEQFPHLTHLDLLGAPPPLSLDDVPYISLDRFLGGSAPSLQHLCVADFEYRGLPSLLLSAPNLLYLEIKDIRPPCYMSPEVMVRALAGLTRLRELCIEFSTWFPIIRDVAERQSPHSASPIHVIFPVLTKFQFRGNSKYLEDFVALVDAPQLEDLSVEYTRHYDSSHFEETIQVGNLFQFISRTETFKHPQFRRATLALDQRTIYTKFDGRQAHLSLIVCNENDRGSSFMDTSYRAVHVLDQLAIMLSDIKHLSIKGIGSYEQEERILESGDLCVIWIRLFRPFPAVDVLHVSSRLAESIAFTINDASEDVVAQMLPALQVLRLADQGDYIRTMASTEQFLDLRRQSGHPVVIVNSYDQVVERFNSHY